MDNLFTLITNLQQEMAYYMVKEIEKEGHKGIVLSHGAILMQFLDKDSINYRELSKRIGKSPQTMTTLVRKLETLGYVRIDLSVTDKRNKLVSITEKGKQFVPVMLDISHKMFDKQYKGFTEEEVHMIRQLIIKMKDNFEV